MLKLVKYLFITLLLFLSVSPCSFSQGDVSEEKGPVYLVPVKGVIDLGLSGFIKRALSEAKEANARAIILDIDTFGGRVDAAVEICDHLEEVQPIKTISFVDDQAWSAGALIALATDEIIMSDGASIGAAEPRGMGGGKQDELTDEKVVSAIRAKFKSIAEENNHPSGLALAMVDKDMELKLIDFKNERKIVTAEELEELKAQFREKDIKMIKTICAKGKLLTLTAKEAKEYNLAKEILPDINQVRKHFNLEDLPVRDSKLTWSENLVRFLTHPIVSPLLLSLGLLGLFFEFKMPGWGVSGTLGALLIALFFWGHYLVGLATWTEIVLFIAGVTLLLLEILVIPGFGLAGISGIILILSSLFLSLIKHPFKIPQTELSQAVYSLSLAVIFIFLGILLIIRLLPQSGFWKNIVLKTEETKEEGYQSHKNIEQCLGKKLKTITSLHPSGRAMLAGKILDVISEGGFIDKDTDVEVISVEGNKLVVKPIE